MASQRKGKGKGKTYFSSSKIPPMDLSRLLTTPQQREILMTFFYEKKLIDPKYGNLNTFPFECFSFLTIFGKRRIKDLVRDGASYYSDIVRVFYSNMSFKDNKLISSLKGVLISLTSKQLGECNVNLSPKLRILMSEKDCQINSDVINNIMGVLYNKHANHHILK